jgi:(heptosyl)LPS beta-1,4-glucosyltransferase
MKMPSVSVVMITMNEEDRIALSLDSVQWADSVVIVDGGSSDRTVEIAKERGARVIGQPFVDFSAQRNRALAEATGEWVLSLDADEIVPPALADEVRRVLTDGTIHAGFEIPFRNHLGGRWMRGGGLYPDYHLRLFRRTGARFEGAVHEVVRLDGSIGRLREAIDHRTYLDRPHLMSKVEHYARLEGAEAARRRIPALILLCKVPYRFLSVYLLKRGCVDGWNGLFHAYALTKYAWIVYRSAAACSPRRQGQRQGKS